MNAARTIHVTPVNDRVREYISHATSKSLPGGYHTHLFDEITGRHFVVVGGERRLASVVEQGYNLIARIVWMRQTLEIALLWRNILSGV